MLLEVLSFFAALFLTRKYHIYKIGFEEKTNKAIGLEIIVIKYTFKTI